MQGELQAFKVGRVVRNKQGGSAYFWGSEIFDFLIFWGLEKTLTFLGLKIFYSWGLKIVMQFIF